MNFGSFKEVSNKKLCTFILRYVGIYNTSVIRVSFEEKEKFSFAKMEYHAQISNKNQQYDQIENKNLLYKIENKKSNNITCVEREYQ